MAIDALGLERDLNGLRELAAAKLADDPIPAGREAERRLWEDIERYELQAEIASLETKGYAVIAPEKAAPLELFERIREAILRIAGEDEGPLRPGLGRTLQHLLPRDPVFEEVLTSPVPLTLVTYMLGWRAKISQVTGLVKDTRTPPLTIHADHSGKFPAPWPTLAQYCNLNWITGDYTRENGAVCVMARLASLGDQRASGDAAGARPSRPRGAGGTEGVGDRVARESVARRAAADDGGSAGDAGDAVRARPRADAGAVLGDGDAGDGRAKPGAVRDSDRSDVEDPVDFRRLPDFGDGRDAEWVAVGVGAGWLGSGGCRGMR